MLTTDGVSKEHKGEAFQPFYMQEGDGPLKQLVARPTHPTCPVFSTQRLGLATTEYVSWGGVGFVCVCVCVCGG